MTTFPGPADCPPGAHLAAFLERRGRPVLEASGAWFVRLARFSYARVPSTEPLEPDLAELDDALRRARATSVQYPTLTHPGVERGGFVCRTAGYSLERIEHQTRRRHVRKGLRETSVRPLDFAELRDLGLELNVDTMRRQRRFERELGTARTWRRFVAAAEASSPHVAAFGAFADGRLSSYTVTCREGRAVHLLYHMSRTADLKRFAAIALDFWLLSEAAKDPTIEVVTNGTVRPSLLVYKASMGFDVVPFRWASRLHPALRAVAETSWCVRATGALSRTLPNSAYARAIANAVRDTRQHA